MDRRFSDLYTLPAHEILYTVFFPDRIYHAQYLNATRSDRYRYNVREVRTKAQITVLKGEVYLDDAKFTNFLRIEYRSSRLTEDSRTKGRLLSESVRAQVRLWNEDQLRQAGDKTHQEIPLDAPILHLHYCPWVDAYQVEIWQHLEPPSGESHHIQVRQMIGAKGSITRVGSLTPALADPDKIREVDLVFYEGETTGATGYYLPMRGPGAARDNFYYRNIQVPVTTDPSSERNTVKKACYTLNFRRGFFVPDASQVLPVRYKNAMMDPRNPVWDQSGIVEMRWLFQEELGGELVFFHEVTIAPGVTEGTHQHLGSEELYYIVRGTGTAFLGVNDMPEIAAQYPHEQRAVMGLDARECVKVPVKAGSVIFTKSGGVHGIQNLDSTEPLVFVAFLYQSS